MSVIFIHDRNRLYQILVQTQLISFRHYIRKENTWTRKNLAYEKIKYEIAMPYLSYKLRFKNQVAKETEFYIFFFLKSGIQATLDPTQLILIPQYWQTMAQGVHFLTNCTSLIHRRNWSHCVGWSSRAHIYMVGCVVWWETLATSNLRSSTNELRQRAMSDLFV